MGAVIVLMAYYLKRMHHSERKAKQSQVLLESIFDQSHQFIGILDQFGRLVSSNSKLQGLLQTHGFDIEQPIWHHHVWEDEGAQKLRHYLSPVVGR